MPDITLRMPDGVNLEFPDGTPTEKIKEARSQYLLRKYRTTDPARIEAARKTNESVEKYPLRDKLIDFIRPVADAAVGSAAAIGSTPFTSPVGGAAAGIAAGTATDMFLQSLRKGGGDPSITSKSLGLDPNSESTVEALGGRAASGLQNVATNELGGAVVNKGMQVAGNATRELIAGAKKLPNVPLVKKGLEYAQSKLNLKSAMTDPLSELEPTYSQYGDRPFSRFFENVFGGASTTEAAEQSSNIVKNKIIEAAAKQSGRKASVITNPSMFGQNIAIGAEGVNKELTDFSVTNAKKVFTIANRNVEPVLDEAGGIVKKITGPVRLSPDTVKMLTNSFQEARIAGITDPSKYNYMTQASNLLRESGAKLDDAGQLILNHPLNVEDVWMIKRMSDQAGYGAAAKTGLAKDVVSPKTLGQIDNMNLSNALNQDIEASMKSWKVNGADAANAFKLSKFAAGKNASIFGSSAGIDGIGKGVNDLNTLITTIKEPIPAINRILGDSKMLRQAWRTGKVNVGGEEIASSNIRKDLGGYKMMDILWNAMPAGSKNFDAGKALSQWKDPTFIEQKNLLFNKTQQANFEELLNNAAKVTAIPSMFGQSMHKMYMVKTGMAIAPPLLAGALSGITNAAEVAAIELPAVMIAKSMSNPTIAKAMQSAIKGGPLGMSAQRFGYLLAGEAQGVGLNIVNKDGSQKTGHFQKDGTIKYTYE